jgi:hypothetical protein
LDARGRRIKGERLPLANHFFVFWQAKNSRLTRSRLDTGEKSLDFDTFRVDQSR